MITQRDFIKTGSAMLAGAALHPKLTLGADEATDPNLTLPAPAPIARQDCETKRTRFLVLDSRIIETAENAKLALGKTVKSKHNPLMAEDKPWEKCFDNLYANVIYDKEYTLYKCWYCPFIVDNSAKGMTLDQRRNTRYRPPRGREMAIC